MIPTTNKASSVLQIDQQAILENYMHIDQMGSAQTACVVKADCYGLGMVQIAPILQEAGCTLFFVATLEEAIALRQILADKMVQIVVLGGLYKGAEGEYEAHNLTPVLNSPEEISRASRQVMLHFDTGMNRLGIRMEEIDLEACASLDISCVLSHFACADEKDHPMNEEQYERFEKIAQHFPHAKKSLANSSGIFRDTKFHHDIVRPGMALYGLNPTPESKNPMRPVVQLTTRILQIRQAKRGETAGYGATYKFKKDTKLAIVALGYADGMLRSFGNQGALYWKHYRLPITGRVSMDLVSVDLSNIPESEIPEIGDSLECIGSHQSVDDLAQAAGTIGYEILTSLGQRYHRIYL